MLPQRSVGRTAELCEGFVTGVVLAAVVLPDCAPRADRQVTRRRKAASQRSVRPRPPRVRLRNITADRVGVQPATGIYHRSLARTSQFRRRQARLCVSRPTLACCHVGAWKQARHHASPVTSVQPNHVTYHDQTQAPVSPPTNRAGRQVMPRRPVDSENRPRTSRPGSTRSTQPGSPARRL